jgi:hypothetical protein
MMSWPDSSSIDLSIRSPALIPFVVYLRTSGWTLLDEDARTSMWRPAAGHDDKCLVLPANQNVTDYRDRVYEALRLVAYVERRSLNEVASDIVYGPADNVAIRLTPDTPSGQAPLSLAHESVTALRSYVTGSGAALNDHSLVLPAHRSPQAEYYASSARLSTFPGSFILSLTLPLTVEATAPAVPGDEVNEVQGELISIPPQPFGRQVTNRMAAVARYAQNLAEQVSEGNERLVSFGQFAADAPNATELEALSGLGGAEQNLYEVRFSQTPLAGQRTAPFALRVTPGQQHVMADAANYLRTKQSRLNVTAQGLIVSLSWNGKYGPGEVTVLGVLDDSGKPRRFHVELTEEDYNEAIVAHRQALQVVVRGDLEMRGTWTWLKNQNSFAIVPGFQYDDE